MNTEMTNKEKVARDIRCQRTSLANRCRILSVHLLKIADKLNSDTPHESLHINDLGEIQATGTIIDAQCGRLMGKISVWHQI